MALTYRVHTFTTQWLTFTVTAGGAVEYLVVAVAVAAVRIFGAVAAVLAVFQLELQ